MQVRASDGKSYEVVASGGDEEVYEVRLGSQVVGRFELLAEGVRVTALGASAEVLGEVADEFVDRGGARMRMF